MAPRSDVSWAARRLGYEQLSPGLFEAVFASATELHPIATEVETGEAVDLHGEIADARTLRLALRGSAALPLLAGPPVELRGRRLIDAGLSAAIPLSRPAASPPLRSRAALADGATHVLVLRSRRAGEVATAPGRLSGALTARALRRVAPHSSVASAPVRCARARTRRCSPATTRTPR